MAQAPSSTGRLDFLVATTTGDPVAAASVTIEGPDGKTYSGNTGADGHWRVADLPPGLYRFHAFDAPGYVRHHRNSLEDVFIRAGSTSDFRLQVIAPKIHGMVTDEDGKPIEGATVTVVGSISTERPGDNAGITGSATTDLQGRYLLAPNVDPSHFLSKVNVFFAMQLGVTAYLSGERAAQVGQGFSPYTAALQLGANTNEALLDFHLRAAPVFHIRGRIAGTLAPDQMPLVWVTDCGATSEVTLPLSVAPRADGSFDAAGILPAFYCVQSEVNQLRSKSTLVKVMDRDIEQVELAVPVP